MKCILTSPVYFNCNFGAPCGGSSNQELSNTISNVNLRQLESHGKNLFIYLVNV